MSNLEKPQPFDPAAAVNAIREKIRGAMLDIIPDAQWDALIRAEVASFTTDRTEQNYYGNKQVTPCGFKVIVREMLEKDLRERVATFLATPEWSARWDGTGRMEAGDAIKKYVTENSGQILSALLSQAIQTVVTQLRDDLRP